MKHLLVVLVLCSFFKLFAQDPTGVQTYHFNKGEVLDILLLSTSSNSTELFDRYKKTAFPVAFEYGYQPVPGHRISSLSLGNHLPSSFLFGKWESLSKREGFLTNITQKVPDFHEQRRELFTYFGLTYYEMKQDLSFSIRKAKYNVVTSFWQKDKRKFNSFISHWKKSIEKAGAKILVQLENGTSPFGYHYDPDLLLIIQWENEKSFHTFAKKFPLSHYGDLEKVHQFILE